VTAVFVKKQYTLRIYPYGGTVNTKDVVGFESGTFEYGTEIELIAIPDENYEFDYWDLDLQGTTNPATIVMDSNKVVFAFFIGSEVTVNLASVGNGTVIPHIDPPYRYDSLLIITPVAEEGWVLYEWLGKPFDHYGSLDRKLGVDENWTAVFVPEYEGEGFTTDFHGYSSSTVWVYNLVCSIKNDNPFPILLKGYRIVNQKGNHAHGEKELNVTLAPSGSWSKDERLWHNLPWTDEVDDWKVHWHVEIAGETFVVVTSYDPSISIYQ